MSDLLDVLAELRRDVAALKAEAEARRVLSRYMFLCDVPLPEPAIAAGQRARAIGELFCEDAVWEGVGGTHGAQFGRHEGREAITAHFERFYSARDPKQVFNTHYLCTEHVRATTVGAEGRWVQFQPWVDDTGASLLRSSRLHVVLRGSGAELRIARYRTENLFVAPLPAGWTSQLLPASVLFAAPQTSGD
jgi:ketosteroid isomerase-like protein